MNKQIDCSLLKEIGNLSPSAANVRRAVRVLGRLSGWWLNRDAIQTAHALNDPIIDRLICGEGDLSCTRGACSIICSLQQEFTLINRAVFFPLEWKMNQSDSSSLPASLRELAEEIRQTVASWKPELGAAAKWGLQPDPRLALESMALDDDIFLSVRSGWVALASGLIAAVYGFLPNPRVASSVDWSPERGALDVRDLEKKIELATNSNQPIEVFAVAHSQFAEAESIVEALGAGIRIIPIGGRIVKEPLDSIAQFVTLFSSQPAAPDFNQSIDDQLTAFALCRHFYLLLTPFSDQAKLFYESHLLPSIVKRCREKLLADFGDGKVTHYVGVVSKSPELAAIGALANAAERVLLLYTIDQKDSVLWCTAYLEAMGIDVEKNIIDGDIQQMIDIVDLFLEGVEDRRGVVIDIKPGNKKMTYALIKAARDDARVFCLQEEFRNDRRAGPGEEVPEFLQ